MADYEVLEPGGHARLVSDIKAYVNRADGVGTMQLADESVTMGKLATSVTDELDGIVHDGDPLNGNVLIGTLAEGTVLTADDAYAAPPKGVEVYGKSTQDGTPTPDAPVEIVSVDDLTLHVCGKNLCGGSALLSNMQSAMPTATTGTDEAGDYIRFTGAMTPNTPPLASGMFKPNTQYTFIIKYQGETAGGQAQMQVVYTDGSAVAITSEGTAAGTVTTSVYVTNASKSVDFLRASWYSGATRIYYDQCGIFEGVLTADQFEPYVGHSVQVLDQPLRSLPDGTRDTLTLSYIGPSEREGWGVFAETLTQNLGDWTILGTETVYNAVDLGNCWRFNIARSGFAARRADAAVLCTKLPAATGWATDTPHIFSNNTSLWAYVESETLENAVASLANAEVIYPLATPITHDLGTVELPVNPAPDLTAWADGGSAQPNVSMVYERDVTIVIEQLEAQIEEILTS